jgi:hypothetical protein
MSLFSENGERIKNAKFRPGRKQVISKKSTNLLSGQRHKRPYKGECHVCVWPCHDSLTKPSSFKLYFQLIRRINIVKCD